MVHHIYIMVYHIYMVYDIFMKVDYEITIVRYIHEREASQHLDLDRVRRLHRPSQCPPILDVWSVFAPACSGSCAHGRSSVAWM